MVFDLPNPVEKAREVKNDLEERNHRKLFYEEQFVKMVENGNYVKAVELIWDEARNLDLRINNELPPEKLAQYCFNRLYHSEQDLENRDEAMEELRKKYEVKIQED